MTNFPLKSGELFVFHYDMPQMTTKPNSLYLLPEHNWSLIYGSDEQRDIAGLVHLVEPIHIEPSQFAAWRGKLDSVEAIFSGWGMPKMDAAFFEVFPNLKYLFYGAGAVSGFVTDLVWERGVTVCNANVANGVSVAEYAVAQIILCLKKTWQQAQQVRRLHSFHGARLPVAGVYDSTVGLVSLGAIGRMVAERLRAYNVRVIAYDPFTKPEAAQALGVELCSLEAVFQRSDVISCHTPWLPETVGMIHGGLLRQMKAGASFINTARGAVINEPDLIATLQARPDLFAVLDVTWPEPPPADSPLYTLDNVLLTPHIAGSMDAECRRMGRMMVDEVQRLQRGEPLRHVITREYARASA